MCTLVFTTAERVIRFHWRLNLRCYFYSRTRLAICDNRIIYKYSTFWYFSLHSCPSTFPNHISTETSISLISNKHRQMHSYITKPPLLLTLCLTQTCFNRTETGCNMLELRIVLIKWWVDNISVHLSVFIWYSDTSARIWTR